MTVLSPRRKANPLVGWGWIATMKPPLSSNHPDLLTDYYFSFQATSTAEAPAPAPPTPEEREPRNDFIVSEWKPEFEARCADDWVEDADVNDVMHHILACLPRRTNLQLNGDCEGVCIAPFLCVNFHLGIRYEQLKKILGDDFGRYLKWGLGKTNCVHRPTGLKRHNKALPGFIFLYIDTTGAYPYVTPGKSPLLVA